MKSRRYIIIVFLIILAGAGAVFFTLKTDGDDGTILSAAASRLAHSANSPLRADAYVDYKPSTIESTPGAKLLFFDAAWSTQSRLLDKNISVAAIPDNVTVIKVDYDANADLRKQYGVTVDATVVRVDDKGNILGKYVAYDNPVFEAIKQHLLQ